MSPELQTTKGSKNIPVKEMEKMFRAIGGQIDGVTIWPRDEMLKFFYTVPTEINPADEEQAKELYKLVDYIKRNITDDIIVFSGYKIEELKQMQSTYVDKTLDLISVLIDGEYVDEQNDGIGIRGSSNQRIYIFHNCNDYSKLSIGERKLQTFRYNGQILVVGIQ